MKSEEKDQRRDEPRKLISSISPDMRMSSPEVGKVDPLRVDGSDEVL